MAYTAQQIQDAIAASRAQGFTDDQIKQGALANFGVDVGGYMQPAPAPSFFGTPQEPDYTTIANHASYMLNNGASLQDVYATMDRAGVPVGQLIQAVQQAHASDGLYAQPGDYAPAAANNDFTGQNWTNLNSLSNGVRSGYDALDGMIGNNVPTTGGLLSANPNSPTGYAADPNGGTKYATGTPAATPAVPGGGVTTPSNSNPLYGAGLNNMLNTLGGGISLQERSGSLSMTPRNFSSAQQSQPLQFGALQAPGQIQGPSAPQPLPGIQSQPLSIQAPQAPQGIPFVPSSPLDIRMPNSPGMPQAIQSPAFNPQNPTLDGYTRNPALDSMLGSLGRQATDTFARNAQAIRSNAGAIGGLGGSRQGVAEGIMGEGLQNSLADQSAKLLYQDFNDSANRNLTKYGQDQQFSLGQGSLANQRYATDVSQNLGLGQLGQARYATDSSNALGVGSLQNQRQANDQQYALGQGQLGQARYAGDQNFALGQAQAQNQRLGLDQSYNLGLGNLGQQRYASDQSFALGQGGLNQQRYATDANYNLGQAQAQNTRLGLDQSYSLGMGGLQNTADANRNNFANSQRALDQSGLALGANLYQQANAGDWGAINNAGNIYSTFGGLNGTSTNSGQSGGGWQGALGGALGVAQLGKNFNWWG